MEKKTLLTQRITTEKPNLTMVSKLGKAIKAENDASSIVLTPIANYSIYTTTNNGIKRYTINSKITLSNTLELDENSIVIFGSSGSISGGTIVGNNSTIIADHKVFYNVNVKGTWDCIGNVGWFADGCKGVNVYGIPNKTDDYNGIQQALDSSFSELVFPPKIFYTSQTLVLRKEKRLVLQGVSMGNSLYNKNESRLNTCIIYTDKNIDLLHIIATDDNKNRNPNARTTNSVSIVGGNFDVSLTQSGGSFATYTANCITVFTNDYNTRIWGIQINTNIFGRHENNEDWEKSIGINLNPISAETKTPYKREDYGYVTQIEIDGQIKDFGTGIKATDWQGTFDGVKRGINWCSSLHSDCNIIDCKTAVSLFNVDADINGMIQPPSYESSGNNKAVIEVDSAYCTSIGANIFDLQMEETANYAVDIRNGGVVQAYGRFAALCNAFEDKKKFCKGNKNNFYV